MASGTMRYALSGKRVFVAGARGMAGAALVRRLAQEGCEVLDHGRERVDLRDLGSVEAYFADTRPQAVFHAAGTVGGIQANDRYPATFLYDNLAMAANVIHAAHNRGVEKLLYLGSSCIYPKHAAQPMTETRCSPAPWSRPISGTRSPRSPGSSCAKPIAGSMAAISSR